MTIPVSGCAVRAASEPLAPFRFDPVAIGDMNDACERIFGSDVKYRFVIDMASLPPTKG